MFYMLFNHNSIIKIQNIINHNRTLLARQGQCLSSRGGVIQSIKRSNFQKQSNQQDTIENKIVYNSKIKHGRVGDINKEKSILFDSVYLQYKNEGPRVLALKYLSDEFSDKTVSKEEEDDSLRTHNETLKINFPYEKHDEVTLNTDESSSSTDVYDENTFNNTKNNLSFNEIKDKSSKRPNAKWMKDYDKYAEIPLIQSILEEEGENEDSLDFNLNYGSSDPNEPPSSVPCGGCGAYLHCQDSAIPGYLPKEIFVGLRDKQLQSLVCQRCHFMREYNTALSVSVDPEIYPQLLSKIRNQKALVILVVDMTDFPCSIWPGILDIIGPKRPLVVVGNKIDLLQDVSRDWLGRAKKALVDQLPPQMNLLHVTLVSAKTGFGIESLITSLYNLWEYRGDVYLVGCTNVGKSTLFNALLQSDYCKSKAVDLVQRATTAPWPGTTLNLLKFPIMRPEGRRLVMRTSRLREENATDLRKIQDNKVEPTPQMISQINRTFDHSNIDKYSDEHWDDPFAMPKMATLRKLRMPASGLDPSDHVFAKSKWLYDTPGVVTSDQIINLLTTEELMKTLPREPIIPRTFQVWPGQTLFLGGLGRLDYIDGPANIKMTVLSAFTLPVTICFIADSEEIYHYYLGSEVLAVPCGGEERLRNWPGLEAAPKFVLKGEGWLESCADVVLSSAGWIAVTAERDSLCHLQGWTPNARGIHVRMPPVLPRAIALKGTRMYKSQAYALYSKRLKNKI